MPVDAQMFVCGVFAEGQRFADLLSPYVVSRKSARMYALAYRLNIGFPVIVFPESETAARHSIEGELVELSAPDLIFKLLDEFHGLSPLDPSKGVYARHQTRVICEDQIQSAFAYALNTQHLPKDAELITDGNWRQDMIDRPSVLTALTEKHACYLKKLGATKGRQVIQYDLNLSRDLMKLGLIVDKGRRLALSRLGKEVIPYLS